MKYSKNKPKRGNEIRGSLLGMKLEPVFWKLSKSPCTLNEKSLDFGYSKDMHAAQGSHFTGCQQNTYYRNQSLSKYKYLAFILGSILITSSFQVTECLPRPQVQADQFFQILSSTTRTNLHNNMNPSSSFQFSMTMNSTPIEMQKSSTNRNTGIYPASSTMVLTNEGTPQRFSQTADPQIISSSPQMVTTRFRGFRTETKTVEETKRISPYDDNIHQDSEGKHLGLNKTEHLLFQSHQIPSTTNPNQLISPQAVSTSASVTPDPGSRAGLSMLSPDVSHLEHKTKNLTGHQNKLQAHKATDSPALSEYLKNKYHQKHSNQTGKELERNKKLLDQYLPIPLTNMLVKPIENEGLTKYVQVNTDYPLLKQIDTDTFTATETINKKTREINTKKSYAIDGLPLVKDRLPSLPQYNKFVVRTRAFSSRAETARERQKDSNNNTNRSIDIDEGKTQNSDSPRLEENPHVNSKQSVQSLSFPHSPAPRSTYLNLFARLPVFFRNEIGNETKKANTGTKNENNEGHKKDSSSAVSASSTPVNIGVLSDDSDSASNVAHKTVGEDFITLVKEDRSPEVMKKPILLLVTDVADTGRITPPEIAEMENNINHMILPHAEFQPQENGYNHSHSTTREALTKKRINVESLPGLLEKLPQTESTSTETKPQLVLIVTEKDSQLLIKPKLLFQAIDGTSTSTSSGSGSGSGATITDDAVVSIINQNQDHDDDNHEFKVNFTSKSEPQSPALEQDINSNQNKNLKSLQHQVFQVPQEEENENREMSESFLALTETPSSGLEIESSESETVSGDRDGYQLVAAAVALTTPPTTPGHFQFPISQEIKFQSFPFLISPPFVTIDGSFMGGKVPPLSLLDELGPVL